MSIKGIQASYFHRLKADVNQPAVKRYQIANVDGNITDVYYADSNATASGVCIRHHFVWTTVSGHNYVQKEEWFTAEWDITWDMTPPA